MARKERKRTGPKGSPSYQAKRASLGKGGRDASNAMRIAKQKLRRALIDRYESGDAKDALDLMEELRRDVSIPRDIAAEVMETVIEDASETVRHRAVQILGGWDETDQIIDILTSALEDDSDAVAVEAGRSLGFHREADPHEILLNALQTNSLPRRRGFAETLCSIARFDTPIEPLLQAWKAETDAQTKLRLDAAIINTYESRLHRYGDIDSSEKEVYADFFIHSAGHAGLVETPPQPLGAATSSQVRVGDELRSPSDQVTLPIDVRRPPYEDQAVVLEDEVHRFRQSLADRLAPVLNAEAQRRDHNTYEEKKALARWVNEQLRRFDVAIQCPSSGQPSILLVMPGHQPEVGRFAIEHKTPDGKRIRSFTSVELPHLDLMEAPPRRESILERRELDSSSRDGASRG